MIVLNIILWIVTLIVLLTAIYYFSEVKFTGSGAISFFMLGMLLIFSIEHTFNVTYEDGIKEGRKQSVAESLEIFKKHHVCKSTGDQLIELLTDSIGVEK